MARLVKRGRSRPYQSSAAALTSKKEIDERRLRKLKVYLKSVSYNSCEQNFATLPDLYDNTILSEVSPCDTMKLTSRNHCAPTPFLIACCFNRRYPVNARRRTGSIRSRPSMKQDVGDMISSAERKKILLRTGSIVSPSERQESKIRNTAEEKTRTCTLVRKLLAETEREKQTKIDKNTKIVGMNESVQKNGINMRQENNSKCSFNVEKISNTALEEMKEKRSESETKGISGCEALKHERFWKDVNCEYGNIVDSTSTIKTILALEKRVENKECETKDCDATNKDCKEDEVQKKLEETIENLENCSTENDESGAGSELVSHGNCCEMSSSHHKSPEQVRPENFCFESKRFRAQEAKASEMSAKTTVNDTPEEAKLKAENVESQGVEKEKIPLEESELSPKQEKEKQGVSSRRSLPRLCNKTASSIKETCNLPRKDAKCEMRISENKNTTLRSRAALKHPGYDMHDQERGK